MIMIKILLNVHSLLAKCSNSTQTKLSVLSWLSDSEDWLHVFFFKEALVWFSLSPADNQMTIHQRHNLVSIGTFISISDLNFSRK